MYKIRFLLVLYFLDDPRTRVGESRRTVPLDGAEVSTLLSQKGGRLDPERTPRRVINTPHLHPTNTTTPPYTHNTTPPQYTQWFRGPFLLRVGRSVLVSWCSFLTHHSSCTSADGYRWVSTPLLVVETLVGSLRFGLGEEVRWESCL